MKLTFDLLMLLVRGTWLVRPVRTAGQGRLLRTLIPALLAVVAAGLLVQESYFFWNLARTGDGATLLTTLYLLAAGLTAVFSLPVLVSNLFFAGDFAMLAPLPLPRTALPLAKLSLSWLSMLPVTLLIALPGLAVALVRGLLAWPTAVGGLLLSLTFSVLPLAAVGALGVQVMRAEAVLRRRGMALFLANSLGFVGLAGFSLLLNAFLYPALGGAPQELVLRLADRWNHGIRLILAAVPPLAWPTRALTAPGAFAAWGGLLAYLLVTAAASAGFVSTAGARHAEVSRRLLVSPEAVRSLRTRAGGLLGQLIQREWWVLSAHRFFIAEGLVELFIGPVVFVVVGILFAFMRPALPQIDWLLGQMRAFPYTDLAAAGVLVMMAAVNSVGPTALSREGSLFYLSKSLPIPYRVQVMAKFCFTAGFSVIATSVAYLGMLVIGIPLRSPLLTPAAALALVLLVDSGVLFFDLLRPSLHWVQPRQAMNGNTNVALNMLWGLGVIVSCAAAAYGAIRLGLSLPVVLLMLTVVGALLCPLTLSALLRAAPERYRRIEP